MEQVVGQIEQLLRFCLYSSSPCSKNSADNEDCPVYTREQDTGKVLHVSTETLCKLLFSVVELHGFQQNKHCVDGWTFLLKRSILEIVQQDYVDIYEKGFQDSEEAAPSLSPHLSESFHPFLLLFLFPERLFLPTKKEALSTIPEKTQSIKYCQCAIKRLEIFCSTAHALLTQHGVPFSDVDLVKTAFRIEEQMKLDTGDAYTARPQILTIGDLVVARNSLSGILECTPQRSTTNKKGNAGFLLTQTASRAVLPSLSAAFPGLNDHVAQHVVKCVARVVSYILKTRVKRSDEYMVAERWEAPIVGHLLPLIERLLSFPNIDAQIDALAAMDSLFCFAWLPVIAQFFSSLSLTLQRCYPVFLSTHGHSQDMSKLTIYVKVFFKFLAAPYNPPLYSEVTSCLNFLFMRLHLNIVSYPERLRVVLHGLTSFIKESPHCITPHINEVMKLGIQAMESDDEDLVLVGSRVVESLILNLPRFCTERYWRDVCLRIVLFRRRAAARGGHPGANVQLLTSVDEGFSSLINAMSECTSSCLPANEETTDIQCSPSPTLRSI